MPPEKAPPTVLVVDDDGANLRTFQRVFRKRFRILLAGSGPEALALPGLGDADVALVDYVMPEMNGIAVLEALRDTHPGMLRFLLTGYGDLEEIALLRGSGLFIDVLAKPWDAKELEAAIVSSLEARGPRRVP